MRCARFILMAAALTFTPAMGTGMAQPAHPPATGMEITGSPTVPDSRISLKLEPAQREALKATMREHLDAIEAVIAAVAEENYRKASEIAHKELGFPTHHEAMQREQGASLPEKYQELAIKHHQAAEDLAEAIQTKEMKRILRKLDETIKACLDCHRAYKL